MSTDLGPNPAVHSVSRHAGYLVPLDVTCIMALRPLSKMVAIEYARPCAQAGIAALIYGHRNFGRSGRDPRHEINPWIQCRGYRAALEYALGLPKVNPGKLALRGDSYTGGQAVIVSACDARPQVIVAQCPVFGPAAPPVLPDRQTMDQVRLTLLSGDVSGTPETTTGPIPVVSPSQ